MGRFRRSGIQHIVGVVVIHAAAGRSYVRQHGEWLGGPMAGTERYHGFIASSERWDDFELRDDDIVISTPSRSGTTWMQTLAALPVFDGVPPAPVCCFGRSAACPEPRFWVALRAASRGRKGALSETRSSKLRQPPSCTAPHR